jgi:plastocyanin
MKTKILLPFMLLFISLNCYSVNWTITNGVNTFSPATLNINDGDNVIFTLESIHDAVEVSLSTYSSNGSTPLAGGFAVAFGGGTVTADQLNVGTHYYVCANHVLSGMKGIIVVQGVAGITENLQKTNFIVNPNPSNGRFQLMVNGLQLMNNCNVEIYNLTGEKIYQSEVTSAQTNIDISDLQKGIYFIKTVAGESILTKKIMIK